VGGPGGTLPLLTAALAVLVLLNAWLVDRFLAQQTPDADRLPRGLRIARRLLAAVPLLGLYAVPLWAWLCRRQPSRPKTRAAAGVGPTFRRRRALLLHRLARRAAEAADRSARRLASGIGLGAWFVVNFVIVLTAANSLAVAVARAAPWLAAAIHLLAFATAAGWAWSETRRVEAPPSRRVLALVPLALVLVPVPFLPLLGLLAAMVAIPTTAGETLLHSAASRATAAARIPLFLALEDHLRRAWRRAPRWRRLRRPPALDQRSEPGREQREVAALYQAKATALLLDAAALAGAALWLAEGHPPWRGTIEAGLGGAGLASLALGGAGLLLLAVLFLQRLVRAEGRWSALDRHPFPLWLAATQLAACVGLQAGTAVHHGDGRLLATVLLLAGLAVTLTWFVPLMLSLVLPVAEGSEHTSRRATFTTLAWLVIAILGYSMHLDAALREYILVLSALLLAAAPLLAPFLADPRLPWLLRPFTLSDLRSPATPSRVRWTLALITASARSPLGGLAVPLWILARHRLWPRLEPRRRGV
jgi:hypothetical protein